MPRGATRTSFQPGQSGNVNGRPKGSQDVMPKVRDLVNAVLCDNQPAAEDAVHRALVNPRHVLAVIELAAKLNREIGSGTGEGGLAPLLIVGDRDAVERVGRQKGYPLKMLWMVGNPPPPSHWIADSPSGPCRPRR